MLIVNKYATLKELKNDYDIWDVLDLYEICMINLYNNFEINNKGGKNGRR